MKYGLPLPKRLKIIKDGLSEKSNKKTYQIKFKGKIRNLPVIEISIDIPKYRLANGRTQAAQEEYVSLNPGAGDKFFRKDFELESAQKAQHEILKKMVNEEGLYSFFKKTNNQQEEPLIIDSNGFVINGNRRLCALRTLLEENKKKYKQYEYIDVAVLPPCEEKEIKELEATLQIKQDIKAQYSWVTFACMLREMRKDGYTDDRLADMYEKKEKEIQNLLDILQHVDEYLENRKKSKQYLEIVNDEYAFKKLKASRKNMSDEAEKDIYTKICYSLIDNSGSHGERLYKLIPEVKVVLPKIIEELKQEFKVKEIQPGAVKENLALLGGSKSKLQPILGVVDNVKNAPKIAEIANQIIISEELKSKQKDGRNYILKLVREANTLLIDACDSFGENSETTGMILQINQIDESTEELRRLLKEKKF